MYLSSFEEICRSLSRLLGCHLSAYQQAGMRIHSWRAGGCDLFLMYAPLLENRRCALVVDLVPPPQNYELETWMDLLSRNHLCSGRSTLHFGRNPETGAITLQSCLELRDAAEDVVTALASEMIQVGLTWREKMREAAREL